MLVNKFKKFQPDLSPHSTRLIRKFFLENKNDKENLIKTLRSQITLFKKLPLFESTEHFRKFNKESVAFQATSSLLADLLEGGWKITLGIDDFQISKPEYEETFRGKSIDEVKKVMRDIQLKNRDKQLKSPEVQNFISRMQRPRVVGNEKKSILDLIDNGKELAEIFKDISELNEEKKLSFLKKFIKPEIVVCYPDDPLFKEEEHFCPYTGLKLSDIWRYFRLTWSSELKSVPGKSFPMLIRNAARPNKPIIGIAMLRSAALSDEARDDLIGWTDEKKLRENIYNKKLDIKFVVKQLILSLNHGIDNIRRDDFNFLNSNLIKNPNDEIIKKLNKIYEEEYEKRKEDLKNEKKQAPRYDRYEEDDWEGESELPLFRKKRALFLARLLEVRKYFNETNIEKEPAKGYAKLVHPSNKKGGEMIGRALREIKSKALAENIMDVSVCGSVAPYNEILGGKLVASLMASEEVRNFFKSRYASKKYLKPSIIASSKKGEPFYRDANLMCLTTTSLYGVASSQYNKIKFLKKDFSNLNQDLIWQEVKKSKKISHKTKGQGVYHFTDETTKLLDILFFKIFGYKQVNHKFGEGTSPKLRKTRISIERLSNRNKVPKEKRHLYALGDDFFAHNIQRKNYVLFLTNDILNKLMSQTKHYNSVNPSKVIDITSAWISRWLLKRIARTETLEKLNKLGPESVKVLLNYEIQDNSNNLFNFKIVNVKKN